MQTAIAVGIVAISLAVAVPVLVGFWDRRSWLPQQTGRRVVVHTTQERTLEGVLVTIARDGIVLRAASLKDPHEVELAGEPFIPHSQIFVIQLTV